MPSLGSQSRPPPHPSSHLCCSWSDSTFVKKVIVLVWYKLTIRKIARMMNGRIIVSKMSYQDRMRKKSPFNTVCIHGHRQHHKQSMGSILPRGSTTTCPWPSRWLQIPHGYRTLHGSSTSMHASAECSFPEARCLSSLT